MNFMNLVHYLLILIPGFQNISGQLQTLPCLVLTSSQKILRTDNSSIHSPLWSSLTDDEEPSHVLLAYYAWHELNINLTFCIKLSEFFIETVFFGRRMLYIYSSKTRLRKFGYLDVQIVPKMSHDTGEVHQKWTGK